MMHVQPPDQKDLEALHRYWQSLDNRGPAPRRSALDPTRFGNCLGSLLVAEVELPFRVRYRLVGERLTRTYGRDLTGRYVDQCYFPLFRSRVLAAYRSVVDTGAPRYELIGFPGFKRRYGYHRLMLPLSRGGARIDEILVGIVPSDPDLRTVEDWRLDPEIIAFLHRFRHTSPDDPFEVDEWSTRR